jgi:hypothetical protein
MVVVLPSQLKRWREKSSAYIHSFAFQCRPLENEQDVIGEDLSTPSTDVGHHFAALDEGQRIASSR